MDCYVTDNEKEAGFFLTSDDIIRFVASLVITGKEISGVMERFEGFCRKMKQE